MINTTTAHITIPISAPNINSTINKILTDVVVSYDDDKFTEYDVFPGVVLVIVINKSLELRISKADKYGFAPLRL